MKFTDIQSNLKFLRQKVSGLDLNDFLAPRPKDLAIIKHITPSTESIRLVTKGPTNYVPEKTLNFLRRHFKEQADGRLTALTLLELRLEKLTDLIYLDDLTREETKPNQYKRGAMDAGGDLLKWLFGTANEKDLQELNVKLQTMTQTDLQIIHSLEDQATLITNGMHRTTTNTKLIQEIRTVLASLDQATSETNDILKEFLMKLQLLFEKIDRKLNFMNQYVEDLTTGFDSLSRERLPPELFSPKELLGILKGIATQLPNAWALALPAIPENLWLYYQNTVVTTAITKDHCLRMFVHVPIYEVKYKFDFYRVFNVPMYNRDSLYGLQYENLPDYLAISADQASHVPLQSQELTTCRQLNSLQICPIIHALQRTHTTPSCVIALFKGEAILDACKQLLTPWKGIYSYHIGSRKWLYSDLQERQVKRSCNNQDVSTIKIDKVAVLEIPRGCSIHSIDWILPPTFRQSTTRVNHSTVQNNAVLTDSNFWFNIYSSNASAENYTRQELLNNISRQINTLEKDDNEIHQLEGMDMDRLKNLSRRVENNLQYVFPIHQLQIVPYIVSTTATVLPLLGIIWIAIKARTMSQRILALEKRLDEHEGLL